MEPRNDGTQLQDWLSPLFLGSYAENDELFERIVVEFVRDHAFWRRNIHPEDRPLIPVLAQHTPEYRDFVARMKAELHGLSARLKRSVPFFHPRYVGHMASDLLLPGLIAQLVTTLYNPNNVTDEAAPVTLRLELEAGRQLAAMLGFSTDPDREPCAWGHVTSGGTLANDEALWYFRAVRYWPLAAARALRESELDLGQPGAELLAASDTGLFNLGTDRVIRLRRDLGAAAARLPGAQARALSARIEAARVESLGMAAFHAAHPTLPPPCVIVPVTAHYSWRKAMGLLGLGAANLVSVPVTERMRLDVEALDAALRAAHERGQPVLAVVGVLGSTEFGSIDPIDGIVALRQRWRRRGLEFSIHVDAAWGGYLASIFRAPDGTLVDRDSLRHDFHHFPSLEVYRAFAALRHADSVTVDPHKLGFVPYGCGAYVARNRAMTDFVTQPAPYLFDDAADGRDYDARLRHLGQYILEGSKPGAAAAAVWVTHRVLPLDRENFGRLCAATVRNCEYFFDHVAELRESLSGVARIVIPFEPDTNLVCLAINPEGNRSLGRMNAFGRRLYAQLRTGEDIDIRGREFFGSHTLVHRSALTGRVADTLVHDLGLDPATFVAAPETCEQANSIFLLRHTLMNPWLTGPSSDLNYLDRYCCHLAELVRREVGAGDPT